MMRIPCPSNAFLRASAIQIDSSLTPFLYQTATIQQWIAPYAQVRPRREQRHASTAQARTLPGKPIELVSDPAVDAPDGSVRSTISSSEKRVFAKLLDPSYDPRADIKARAKSPSKIGKTRSKEVSINADQLRINDAYLQAQHQQLLAAKRKASAAHQEQVSQLQAAQDLPYTEETETMRQQREQMFATAKLQFSRARTDKELLQLLDKWAFDVFRKYFSLGQAGHQDAKKGAEPEQKEWTLQLQANFLTQNYPLLLVAFLDELRDNFPSSQLAFSILPMVKSLGLQSYALGASTQLYNGIILDTWRIFSDFHRINELLIEMENAGLEFDYDTLEVLAKIRRQGDRILKGDRGELLKRVWQLDSMMSGWTTVVGWIPKVKDSLEREELRRANESAESEIEDSVSGEEWNEEFGDVDHQDDRKRATTSLG
ncbi:uncharacterized protein PV09_03460 [Verruconis gallopava]|uniref:Mtf2-like C-terminal domain-containing protein n=1 Tax=Verruconis gallopava TaxID=253628 RepID=A0A0D2AGC1_9PEZI|nr:uncharacterized protein PV09_03460 [Verruconis gallopava]KIW05585.1 hypothetical protein PV09_03460 [Verruconis gallopava]